MSFDVYLQRLMCSHCNHTPKVDYEFNLTHNVNTIVDECLLAGGATEAKDGNGYANRSWGRLAGWKGSELIEILTKAHAFAVDKANEERLRATEPSNKWGTLESVRFCIANLRDKCAEFPDSVICVSG